MNNLSLQSRRNFLIKLAKTGMLLPFAGQLLGQHVMAQTGRAKRVLFLYYPNGVVPYNWRPLQTSGSISGNQELSFGLGPLKDWHQHLIVCRNLNLDIGQGAGAHYNDMRGILTGDNTLSASSASIDHLIAERLTNKPVLSLGVRTGAKSDAMISKPRNYSTTERPVPSNDPADVAKKLALNIGGGETSSDKRRLYESILTDFDQLSDITLSGTRQEKLNTHMAALRRLRDQSGVQVGECGFNSQVITDPYVGYNGQLGQTGWQLFPQLCRAQIDNIIGAFSCGLHDVATLQLSKGDENGNLVNYSFDECYGMAVQAIAQGIKHDPNSGTVGTITRWYNEYASHNASHRPGDVPHTAQVRWYHSLLAYTLEQLQAKGLLADTLVVMFSEVGDGSKHGGAAGAVTLAGGAGGALQMGRIIDCGDGVNNGHRIWGTHELFGDIAKLLGVNQLPEAHWRGGMIT